MKEILVPNELSAAYEEVDKFLDSAQFPQAIEKMKAWGKVEINQFYLAYPHRYPILKHEAFNEFWAEKRAELYPKNPFVTQKHVRDCEFVLGYVFYLLSIKFKASSDKSEEFLQRALEFDSIHAAQTYLHQIIMKKGDQEEKIEILEKTLSTWNRLAAKHGAPGFLLLANGYLHLAKTFLELNSSERYEEACFELWKNLTLVQLEEPQSEASINNAYFGHGFALGNPLKLPTVEEIKESASKIIADNTIKTRAATIANASFIDDESKSQLSAWRQSRSSASLSQPIDFHELEESDLLHITSAPRR